MDPRYLWAGASTPASRSSSWLFALLLAFTFAMSWVGVWLGLSVPSVEVAAGLVHRHLPHHVRVQRVRAHRHPAVVAPAVRRVEPGEHAHGGHQPATGDPYATNNLPSQEPIATIGGLIVIVGIFAPARNPESTARRASDRRPGDGASVPGGLVGSGVDGTSGSHVPGMGRHRQGAMMLRAQTSAGGRGRPSALCSALGGVEPAGAGARRTIRGGGGGTPAGIDREPPSASGTPSTAASRRRRSAWHG